MNVFKKIEALLFADEPTPVNFKDAKLKDGSTIRVTEDLIIGAKVELINEDGTLTIPTEGELILEDGSTVYVDANGLITDIKTQEAAQAEGVVMAEPEAETVETDMNEINIKRFQAIESKINELINAYNALTEAFNSSATQMEAVKSENVELKSLNDELSKKVSAPAANFKKFEKTTEVKENKSADRLLDKVIAIRESKNNN